MALKGLFCQSRDERVPRGEVAVELTVCPGGLVQQERAFLHPSFSVLLRHGDGPILTAGRNRVYRTHTKNAARTAKPLG